MNEKATRKDGGRGGEAAAVIFLFDSTHDAMQAEEAIIDAGFWCDVVPRPPDSAATLCGLAIEAQAQDEAEIAALLKKEAIDFKVYEPAAR